MGEDSEEEEYTEDFGQVFVREETEKSKKTTYEPTEEELAAVRASRLASQSNNPNYLKVSPSSPLRTASSNGVEEIAVQAIDLEVPLHIPGLASADSYFNLESKRDKKKKKKKKTKKAASSSEED